MQPATSSPSPRGTRSIRTTRRTTSICSWSRGENVSWRMITFPPHAGNTLHRKTSAADQLPWRVCADFLGSPHRLFSGASRKHAVGRSWAPDAPGSAAAAWPVAHLDGARYWAAFALFVLAVLSKSVTATLPAALLVVFWWKRGRLGWRRDVSPLISWFVVAAAGGAFTAWVERDVIGARGADFSLTLLQRCLLAGRALWFYLAALLWPSNLIFIYPHWTIDASRWPQYVFPVGAIATAICLWLLRGRTRAPLAGFLFFAGTLFPALGFVDAYPFRFSYVADHFQYLAGLGVIVPIAAGLTLAAARQSGAARSLVRAGCVALVGILGVLTWRQSASYRDAETLYRDTISRNPECWMAHVNLGTELADQKRLPEAIR